MKLNYFYNSLVPDENMLSLICQKLPNGACPQMDGRILKPTFKAVKKNIVN